MPDSISPQTTGKIRQFCQKISIAYDLDDEIQEELYGHIEDRVLGYLTGEEQLTEEDAFVLVREHFGNPENVKELMKIAHSRENRKTLSGKVIRKSMVIVAVSVIAAWFIAGHVYTIISGMVTSTGINFLSTNIPDSSLIRFKVALFMGIFMSLPFVTSYILSCRSSNMNVLFPKPFIYSAILATCSFLGGILFSLFVLIPYFFSFFKHFIPKNTIPGVTFIELNSTLVRNSILVGLIFELPFIAYIFGKTGIVNYTWLSRYHRHAIVAIFIIAAVMTPPDPFSQIILAIPLLILYEFTLQVIRISGKKRMNPPICIS